MALVIKLGPLILTSDGSLVNEQLLQFLVRQICPNLWATATARPRIALAVAILDRYRLFSLGKQLAWIDTKLLSLCRHLSTQCILGNLYLTLDQFRDIFLQRNQVIQIERGDLVLQTLCHLRSHWLSFLVMRQIILTNSLYQIIVRMQSGKCIRSKKNV